MSTMLRSLGYCRGFTAGFQGGEDVGLLPQ